MDPGDLPRKIKVKKSEALWLMTFSDLSFVLLCFFVLMFSYSSTDTQKFDNVRNGLEAKTSKVKPKEKPKKTLKTIEENIKKIIKEKQLQHVAEVTYDAAGVSVEFKNHALFRSGTAKLDARNNRLVGQVLKAIADTPDRYKLEIEGHTDDVPIRTRRFRNNWDLSASRAVSLVQRFRKQGVHPDRMSVLAYAETRPKVPYQQKKGKDLRAARAKNRRVVIRIR